MLGAKGPKIEFPKIASDVFFPVCIVFLVLTVAGEDVRLALHTGDQLQQSSEARSLAEAVLNVRIDRVASGECGASPKKSSGSIRPILVPRRSWKGFGKNWHR